MKHLSSFTATIATVLLCVTLWLAWIGQKFFLATPPSILKGCAALFVAALLFLLLSRWSEYDEERRATFATYLKNLVSCSPLGIALVGAGVLATGASFWLHTQPAMLPWPTLIAWVGGIVLFLTGTWLWNTQLPDDSMDSPSYVSYHDGIPTLSLHRWEMLAMLLLMVLAFLLRQAYVANIPNSIHGDEGEMGLLARKVLDGTLRDPFITEWLGHPTLWFFFQGASLKVFGDTIGGLRMLSAVIGAATVPVLYVYARMWYGWGIALMATSLLTVFHFHIHYSRFALNNIADPLLALAFFIAFFAGLRTRSLFWFALAGFVLGFGFHFYMGARLLVVLFFALLAHQFLLNRTHLLSLRIHLVLFVVGFVCGMGPLLHTFLARPDVFMARFDAAGVFSGWFTMRTEHLTPLQVVAEQLRGGFGAYTFVPDSSLHYRPKIALLDPASSVLFVFGLVLAVARWRRVDTALLVFWVLGTAFFGGVMLASPPESPRYVITAPALCLLIALSLAQIGIMLHTMVGLPQWAIQTLAVVAVVLFVAWNLNFYFNVFTPRINFAGSDTTDGIGYYLATQADTTYTYFFGAPRIYLGHGSIRFLAPDTTGVDVIEPLTSPEQLPPLPAHYKPVFVFLPERRHDLHAVRMRYPTGNLYEFPIEDGSGLLFVAYEPDTMSNE